MEVHPILASQTQSALLSRLEYLGLADTQLLFKLSC